MAHCAISLISNNKVSESQVVKRFLKGCFRLRPRSSKYNSTWDVNIVLKYLEKLGNNKEMTLKNLTFKTTMLLALSTAQRSQTISQIRTKNIVFESNKLTIRITDIIKNSRPGTKQPTLTYRNLMQDRASAYTVVSNHI